ncbi:hypothetical protein B0T10DRAFT_566893 [Thelonectria olida]|uniref:FAD-binding PCMH-type domain-containing protein n=1 Tax=Thelonectria olida TaxID=1576542 RepID=A0A9P8VSS1_9HYPO|nr:hypothetical protein B0T10DRAFT_566893 [Thelonectria olida]
MATDKFLDLRGQLSKGRLLLPGDEAFQQSLQRWSLTCVKPAGAVVQPGNVEEVSIVVKFAVANKIPFNVKGGGHSTSQTSSAPSEDGIVVDLGLMRNVSVDPSAQTVTFEGGCVWGDVDDALAPHKLATPGGTVSHTGVGGLILHGGYGILSGLHGLTIDVLESCQVVLADGSIVTASETENTDLFWALRGAGSSFGVVTQFTSRVFPQGDIWGGLAIFPTNKLPTLVEFLNHWAKANDGQQILNLGFGHLPPGPDGVQAPMVLMQFAHAGPGAETDGPAYFAPVLDSDPIMKQVGSMPYATFNTLNNDLFAAGKRYLFGGANFTVPLQVSTAEKMQSQFRSFVAAHPGKGLEQSAFLLEGIPNRKTRSVPVSSMAFNNRGDYYNVGIAWTWNDDSLDEEIRSFNRKFQKELRSMGYDDANHQDGVGRYLNYVSTETISAETAFGSNAQRLRELKQRYDADNVFDKLWKLLGKAEKN